jgi:hypothetical protein
MQDMTPSVPFVWAWIAFDQDAAGGSIAGQPLSPGMPHVGTGKAGN